MPNRGHSLTIDHGWHEVAQTPLDLRQAVRPGQTELRPRSVAGISRLAGRRPTNSTCSSASGSSTSIDAEEFYRMLDGVVINDTGLFNTRLKEWEDFDNFHRPHGALGGQTPYERLREKTRAGRERPPSAAQLAQEIPRAAMCPAASGGRTVEPVTEEDVRCAA
jgi:hypothetical protein